MEIKYDRTTTTRPLSVLETLGDVLTSAFDEEMALWRGATQSFHAMTLRQCHESTTSTMVSVDEDKNDGAWQYDIESVDVTASASHSGGSVVVDQTRNESLEAKWAELEAVLASLRPRSRGHRHVDSRKRLSRQSTRNLQSNIHRLRQQTQRIASRRRTEDTDDSPHEVCKKVLHAWVQVTRENTIKRAKCHAAQVHYHRSKCALIIRAWQSLGRWRHKRHQRDNVLSHALCVRRMQLVTRRWWIASRWTRGYRRLATFARVQRVQNALQRWQEVVETARAVKRLRHRVSTGRNRDAFICWRNFTSACLERRQQAQIVHQFRLQRVLSAFVQGTRTAREQHTKVLLFHRRQVRTVLQRTFKTWNSYNDSTKKMRTAIEWWRHCQLSRYFEAWNLLHRCFVYHKQVTVAARTHHVRRMWTWCFRAWREFVSLSRKQRNVVEELMKRSELRKYFRHLQDAVQADRDRTQHLQIWKSRRCIAWWHHQNLNRKRLRERCQAAQKIHRDRVLLHVAWRPWREAFLSKVQLNQRSLVARRHVLLKWWCRWNTYGSMKKAQRVMLDFVDGKWKRKKQRWAIQMWQMFNSAVVVSTAKLDICTRHWKRVLIQRSFRCWSNWLTHLHKTRKMEATAQVFYCRLVLHRWCHRARCERLRDDTIVLQTLHQRPTWLKRSCFGVWKRYVVSRVCCRQQRLLRLWYDHATRISQARDAQYLRRRLWIRRMWMSWARYTITRTRHRTASSTLLKDTRYNVLKRVFNNVWRSKIMRYREARRKLKEVSGFLVKQRCIEQWRQRLTAEKQIRHATSHFHLVIQQKCFHRLRQYAVVRPRKFMIARALRTQRHIFNTWKAKYDDSRNFRHACHRLDHWRKHQTLRSLVARINLRRRLDQLRRIATRHYQRCVFARMVDRWIAFTVSMTTCRAATTQLRSRQLHQVFNRWHRALVHQRFIHDLEMQHDEALLRRWWSRFIHAIHHKQAAREKWLTVLTTILERKTFCRWQQLVEARRVLRLTAEWLYIRSQRRLLLVAFDEWTHFTTVRAFVHLRQRLQANVIKAKALRYWKVFVIVEYRRRVRALRVARIVFQVWKRFACARAAAREVRRRSGQFSMSTAWNKWKIECWILQMQTMTQTSLLQRCLDAWRSTVRSSRSPASAISTRRAMAFNEALILQRIGHHQRLLAQRVIQAWALAAQTIKRQRQTELSQRRVSYSTSRSSAVLKPSSRPMLCVKTELVSSSSTSDFGAEENVNPNKKLSKRSSLRIQLTNEDRDFLVLEMWSARMLRVAFGEWRAAVETKRRPSREDRDREPVTPMVPRR